MPEKQKVKQKILNLINAINGSSGQHKDSDLRAVEDFIADCGSYVERVTAMEAALATARYHMEPDNYQDLIVRLDRNRKYAHDALIASVRLMNRLCGVYNAKPVYTGPDERILIAELAAEVAMEFFKERKM